MPTPEPIAENTLTMNIKRSNSLYVFIPTLTAVSTFIQVLLVLPLVSGPLELTTNSSFLEINPHLPFLFYTQPNPAPALGAHPSLSQPRH